MPYDEIQKYYQEYCRLFKDTNCLTFYEFVQLRTKERK